MSIAPEGYVHLICGKYVAVTRFSEPRLKKLVEGKELVRCPECRVLSLGRLYKPSSPEAAHAHTPEEV